MVTNLDTTFADSATVNLKWTFSGGTQPLASSPAIRETASGGIFFKILWSPTSWDLEQTIQADVVVEYKKMWLYTTETFQPNVLRAGYELQSDLMYNATSGNYSGSVSTLASNGTSYAGEWLGIQFPTAIKYFFTERL